MLSHISTGRMPLHSRQGCCPPSTFITGRGTAACPWEVVGPSAPQKYSPSVLHRGSICGRRSVPPPTSGETTHPWKAFCSPSDPGRGKSPPPQGEELFLYHGKRHLFHRVSSIGLAPLPPSGLLYLTYLTPIALSLPQGGGACLSPPKNQILL